MKILIDIIICTVIFVLGVKLGSISAKFVESKVRITPDIQITIKNNVADTTFIYRKGENG